MQVLSTRLSDFELFADLSAEELRELARSCDEMTARSGSTVIRQGQVGTQIYLMEEGSVSIYREQNGTVQPLVELHAPAVFGEMAIVNPERIRTASVKALSNLRLLGIPANHFRSFLRDFPGLRNNFMQMLTSRTPRK